MIDRDHQGPDGGTAEAQASDWVLRLSGAEAGEADWLAFQAWLNAAPSNRSAFDAAEALWLELGDKAEALAEAVEPPAPIARARPTSARRQHQPRWIYGLAACLAIAVIGVAAGREYLTPPTIYQTGTAQRLKATLPDGSVIALNSGSKASVRYGLFTRKVELVGAEAAFDVVPDARRPFLVAVNDSVVRVVGTEFNIRSDGEDLAVTVRRGVVQVAPRAAATPPVRIAAGQQLLHRPGTDRLVAVPVVDDTFSWRSGHLVYRARPLTEVVGDLNRYFSAHIVLKGDEAAALNFSGVIALDTEDAVIARLCELLPLAASVQNGSIVLQARQITR